MDLGFIKKKLIGKHYQSASDCIADFKQMFENCETYNRDKDDVRNSYLQLFNAIIIHLN